MITRERWLINLASLMKPAIENAAMVKLPDFRVSCSFPSKSGMLGLKRRVRGECWPSSASQDNQVEIIVTIVEADVREIAIILSHELIHACFPGDGHGKLFCDTARRLGFVGPFSSANVTEFFWNWINPLLKENGAYPHAPLLAQKPEGAPKKQSARLIKCHCLKCGYLVRTSRKWIEYGIPHCPIPGHGQMDVELPDM